MLQMPLTYQQHTHPWRMQIHTQTKNQNTQKHFPTPKQITPILKMEEVGIDLSNKSTTNFKNLKPDMEETISPQVPQILLPEEECLKNDKLDIPNHVQTIPEYILASHHIPTHHRPELIRAIAYTINPNGQLIPDPTYRGKRQLKLI